MAKSIQDLRRERGYRSAREFADALGVSPSSLSRYDRDPESIPVKAAWAMADLLGCSIDEVVGREPVTSGRSELQEAYDSLSDATRALVDEFLEFAKSRDARERRRSQVREDRRYEGLARFYERMLYQSLDEGSDFGAVAAFATPEAERAAFAAFVEAKAAEKRKADIEVHLKGLRDEMGQGYIDADGRTRGLLKADVVLATKEEADRMEAELAARDREVTTRIMEAYDRLHGTGTGVDDANGAPWHTSVAIEYLGTQRP